MLQAQYNQHNNIFAQHHQFHQAAMTTQFNAPPPAAQPPSYDEVALEKDFSQFKIAEKKRKEYFANEPNTSSSSKTKTPSIASNSQAWIKAPNGSNQPPIVIPQTSAKLLQKNLAPFSRAYPVQLAQFGIEKEEFIKIIDELNECFVLSPAFQIVRMAGMAVGCVPSPTLIGIGAGLQLAAGLGGAGVTYARTKAFVKKVNKNIFDQHGLQMRILTTEKMMEAIGEPEGERKLNLAPLPDFDCEWDPTSPQTDPRLRRMTALADRVGELDWNVPEPVMSKNVLRKMGDWQAQKQAKSVQKRHEKVCSKVNKYQNSSSEKKRRKGERKVEKIEKREGKTTQRIRWICIIPKSQSEQISDDTESEDAESEWDNNEKK